MSVEFEYWGEHELSTRLSLEDHRGRYFCWFKKESFSQKWFDGHIAEIIADAGPRYTPELNVDLPIAHLFEGLGRTPHFFAKMQSLRGNLVKVHTKLQSARSTESAKDAFNTLRRGVDRLRLLLLEAEETDAQQKDLKGHVDAAFESRNHVSDCQQLLKYIQEAAKDTAEKERASGNDAVSKGHKRGEDFGYLGHHLYDLSRALAEITDFFGGTTAELANVGALLLVGEAGTGKTHLFCDVAKQRVASGMPTVLLLGQHFSPSAEPWSQMTQLLGLGCGKEELLGALEAAAQARGGKALIMIDGLNEGEGRNVWYDHLPGILTVLRRFPRVAIALSLRSSYEDLIVPAELPNDKLVKETHYGFANHEYEATKTFFEYFGIERPAVPILHPEFQNPMFYHFSSCSPCTREFGEFRKDHHRRRLLRVASLTAGILVAAAIVAGAWSEIRAHLVSKYPPAKRGALVCEPFKAAAGSLTRPRKTTGDRDVLTCRGALLNLPGHFPCYTLRESQCFSKPQRRYAPA